MNRLALKLAIKTLRLTTDVLYRVEMVINRVSVRLFMLQMRLWLISQGRNTLGDLDDSEKDCNCGDDHGTK